jgi:hypothetical protein
MTNKKNENTKFLQYKGRNLVRCDKILCYGNPDDEKVVLMEIMNYEEKISDIDISNRISIALFNKQDLIKNNNSTFLNHCERNGLYSALEVADLWLSNKDS